MKNVGIIFFAALRRNGDFFGGDRANSHCRFVHCFSIAVRRAGRNAKNHAGISAVGIAGITAFPPTSGDGIILPSLSLRIAMKKPAEKSAVKKSRVAVKKSATNSNSRRAKKAVTKSAVAARKSRKVKSLIGANIAGFKILGDIMESEVQW